MQLQDISLPDIRARIERDNPWWRGGAEAVEEFGFPKRVYFDPFCKLALNFQIKRAAILLGPRRVGKTVMLKQLIARAIEDGFKPENILYVSIDTPIYSNIGLENFLSHVAGFPDEQCLVVFDEIQYLRDWQVHLKDLVDNYPRIKFVVSGSAAAALSLQSKESGAGRFSDFMLPPLTFAEFIDFSGKANLIVEPENEHGVVSTTDIDAINGAFVDYLNFGGYPEAVFNEVVRSNPDQFIRTDIIEKVLLKDLPSLYGISDIQQLNKLFMMLAYNAGHEASYENISQASGITKPMIKKYIEYLESAFLIIKVSRVQENCKTMQRERTFKVYLNNPSMRSALISPVKIEDHELIGHLAESAVFSQWQHSPNSRQLRYARWNSGEVDVIYLNNANEKPVWIGEVKWSDRYEKNREHELRHVRTLISKHQSIKDSFFTTRSIRDEYAMEGRPVRVFPTALYCYTVGRNTTSEISMLARIGEVPDNER